MQVMQVMQRQSLIPEGILERAADTWLENLNLFSRWFSSLEVLHAATRSLVTIENNNN